jgi:hypothetical protein
MTGPLTALTVHSTCSLFHFLLPLLPFRPVHPCLYVSCPPRSERTGSSARLMLLLAASLNHAHMCCVFVCLCVVCVCVCCVCTCGCNIFPTRAPSCVHHVPVRALRLVEAHLCHLCTLHVIPLPIPLKSFQSCASPLPIPLKSFLLPLKSSSNPVQVLIRSRSEQSAFGLTSNCDPSRM